jgi:tetratricopeptide (TPR) repeat protein
MTKRIQVMVLAAVLCLAGATACTQSNNWETLNRDATELYRAGKYERAITVAKKALEVAEKSVGPDHPNVATTLNILAEIYREQRQYAQAEPLHRRALTIRENALGPDHPSVARSVNNLAVLYKNQGQYAQAEPLLMRALAIQEKALGPEPSRCGAEPEQPG